MQRVGIPTLSNAFLLGALAGIAASIGIALTLTVAWLIAQMNATEPVNNYRRKDKRWSAPR